MAEDFSYQLSIDSYRHQIEVLKASSQRELIRVHAKRVPETGGNSRGDASLRVFNSSCKGICGSVRGEMLNWGWIDLLVFETKNTRFREAETMGTPATAGYSAISDTGNLIG